MPGYGLLGPSEGTGLLPWHWARERLRESRNYWAVTLWPDGRPHAMPIWGVWDQETFWFSSGLRSRKARNVAGDPRCVITTEDALNPVTVEGSADVVRDADEVARVLGLINDKYLSDLPLEFMDPDVNATIRVRPRWAFGLAEEDFTGSPTRWSFDDAAAGT